MGTYRRNQNKSLGLIMSVQVIWCVAIKPIADKLEFGIEFDWYGQMVIDGSAAIRKKQRRKGHTTKRIK
jgi:hypothetical protein